MAVHRPSVPDVHTPSAITARARSNVCTEKSTANCRHNDAKATPATKHKRATALLPERVISPRHVLNYVLPNLLSLYFFLLIHFFMINLLV